MLRFFMTHVRAERPVAAMARKMDLFLTPKEALRVPLSAESLATVAGALVLLKERGQFQECGPDTPNERNPDDQPGDEKMEPVAA